MICSATIFPNAAFSSRGELLVFSSHRGFSLTKLLLSSSTFSTNDFTKLLIASPWGGIVTNNDPLGSGSSYSGAKSFCL